MRNGGAYSVGEKAQKEYETAVPPTVLFCQ